MHVSKSTRMVRLLAALAAAVVLTAPLSASAQGVAPLPDTPTSPKTSSATTWDGPLAALLPAFFTDMATVAPGDINHTPHFVRGLQSTIVGLELGNALASQITSFPVVSPAGSFDVGSGGERALTTRAPILAERGTTLGRGRFASGVSFHRAKADAFSDIDLDSGEMVIYAPHNNSSGPGANASRPGDGNPAFERDVLAQTLRLEMRQSIMAFSFAYGLASRFDLGVIVPLVDVSVNAQVTSRIHRVGTAPTPVVHSFDALDLANRTMSRAGSATGLGDVRVRAKLNALRGESSAVALTVDAALPTGDEDNLLGSGTQRIRGGLVLSGDVGRLSPFLNAGYTMVASGEASALASTWQGALDPGVAASVDRTVPNEIDYAGGFTFSSRPWMTFEVEAVGRTLLDAPRFAVGGTFGDELLVDARGTVHRVQGMAGIRLRAGSRLLLNGGVVFPIMDKGLRSKARPIVSLDWAF
jgi:hypothetical protein